MDNDSKLLTEAYGTIQRGPTPIKKSGRTCPLCGGSGVRNKVKCPHCKGRGKVRQELAIDHKKGMNEEAPQQMIARRTVALNNLQAERDNFAQLLDQVLTSLPHSHPWLDPKLENECWEAIFSIEDQM